MTKEQKATREMRRFERWMLKRVRTIHYADNDRMSQAYIKVYNNTMSL